MIFNILIKNIYLYKIIRLLSCFNLFNKTKPAFTLAEILITLLIIGTVAALTVPTLINDTRDRELKEKFRKTYATISNAYKLAVAENGGTLYGTILYHRPFLNKFSPYMHTTKSCGDWWTYQDGYYPGWTDPYIPATPPGTNNGQCYISTKFKYLNGTIFSIPWPDEASVVLTDGSVIILSHQSVNCTTNTSYTAGITYNMNTVCATILLDVNGNTPPNTAGKDIFGIWLFPTIIAPFGVNDSAVNTCNSSSSGLGCAAEYLKQ